MMVKFLVLLFLGLAMFSHANADSHAVDKSDSPREIASLITQNDAVGTHEEEEKFIKDGYCHWGHNTWYKPTFAVRCNCLKCVCKPGGKWDCQFEFGYCPYYYCGNAPYDPNVQLCCCGKVQSKKGSHACCGFAYYDTRSSKCCNYYTIKPKAADCPRYKV